MNRLTAIARRETGAFFHGPMGPAVLAAFLCAVGLFFTIFLLGYSEMSLSALQSPRSGNTLNLAEGLFRPLVSNTIFFMLFLVPAITMRLFSPEYSSGRYDLIASWPVADRTWVLGKWLSAVWVGLVMIGCSLAYFAAVWLLGSPEIGPALSAVLGEVLFVAALAAVGVLASTLFAHQMVAYFVAFVGSLFLFLVGVLERFVPEPFAAMAGDLSLLTHFERFSRGVVDSRDVVYFLLLTAVPLIAAEAVLRARRLPVSRGLGTWSPPVLGLALAVAVYILAAQQPWTADLTGNKRYSLAPQTLRILDGLPGYLQDLEGQAAADGGADAAPDHVMVYAFFQRLDPARDVAEALLKACAQRTRSFRFRVLDPETELDLVRRYEVTVSRTVIVEVGDDWASLLQPEESGLISAVYRMVSGRRTIVCNLLGHGEHLLDSDERPGYSSYGQVLREQGYDVRPLYLAEMPRVPEACDVLVVAGPRTQPEDREMEAIDEHLDRGGAVLALMDPGTPDRWGAWLSRWRVGLSGLVLVSAEQANEGFGVSARTMVVTNGYGDHEVSRPLQGVVTVFPLVQPLQLVGEPDSTVAGAIILQSGEATWAEVDPATRYGGRPTFERGVDIPGPLPFGMVLEIRSSRPDTRPGRLVVIGNSEFASNANINLAANRDLLLNALGWLAREEDLVELRGRDPLSQPVVLDRQAKLVFGWGAALGWPVLVGSIALGFMLRHRRRGAGS